MEEAVGAGLVGVAVVVLVLGCVAGLIDLDVWLATPSWPQVCT